MDLNELMTMHAIAQLASVTKLLAGPRARRGNVSDMISHGTGPHSPLQKREGTRASFLY